MSRRTALRSPFLVLAALVAGATAAQAAPLAVSSYDTPNGDGQAHLGSYNYWDATYDGLGNVHRDGLSGGFLHGGTGALTDGVIATQAWNAVSDWSGTGEYVGWRGSPTITFHFANTVTIDSIKLYVDDSNIGGVTSPGAIAVNGTQYDNSDYPLYFGGPQTITLDDLDIVGNTVKVTLDNPTSWVFLSEIQFFSAATAVPENGNLAMMLAGLGLLGLASRRRRA
jgi:hypothetical protein